MRPTFVFLISFTLLPLSVYGQEDRHVIKRDPDDATRYICDVKFATFKTPQNWRPNRSDKQTYAILTRADESSPDVTEMISIDIGKPVVRTAKLMAEALAKKWNGSVVQKPLKVDGEEAFRVKMAPDSKNVRPIDCVVVLKDGQVFMLIGGGKSDKGLAEAIDEVVASWKWKR
jgi:hypothetical protein